MKKYTHSIHTHKKQHTKAKNQTYLKKKKSERDTQQAKSGIMVGIRKLREKRFVSLSPFPWNSLEVSSLGAFTVKTASFGVTSGTAATAGTS